MQTTDKFSQTLTILPEFANGEQPSALKLNIIFNSVHSALTKLEGVVGPVRDNGANPLSNYPQRLTNMARTLGPGHGLNRTLVPPTSTYVATMIPITDRNNWTLPVWPYTTAADASPLGPHIVFDGDFHDRDGADVFATYVSDPDVSMTATGQYTYDVYGGKLHSFSLLDSIDGTVFMTSIGGIEGVYPVEGAYLCFDSFGNARENVIPHPSLAPATSVVVSQSSPGHDGTYLVTLNPDIRAHDTPPVSPNGSTFNVSDQLDGVGAILGQLGAAPFVYATERLPHTLPVHFDALNAGDLIPQNALFLHKDASTQVIDNFTYLYKDQTSFYMVGPTLVTGAGYRVMSPGANINEVVENLVYNMQNHRHRGPRSISHDDLSGKGYGTDPWGLSASPSCGWARPQSRSLVEGNAHPQYLMRNGYSWGGDPENLDNSMLGDIAFGFAEGTYATAKDVNNTSLHGSLSGRTHGLMFGGVGQYGGKILVDTALDGTSFMWNHYPFSMVHGNQKDIVDVMTVGTSNRIDFSVPLPSGHLFAASDALNSFYRISGVSASIISNLEASSLNVDLFGYNNTIECTKNTSVDYKIFGKDISLTATNMWFGQINVVGSNLNVALPYTLEGFCADIIASNTTFTLAPSDADLMAYSKYIRCDNFTVDMNAKQVNMPLVPDRWKKAHESGGIATNAAYYDRNGAAEIQVFATAGVEEVMFQFLHLPPDAHLHQLQFVVDHDGCKFTLFEAGTGGTYFAATATTIDTPTEGKATFNWNMTTTSPGSLGNRFPTYGGTSVGHTGARDIMVKLENLDEAVGMTAYLSRYTYNLMRM